MALILGNAESLQLCKRILFLFLWCLNLYKSLDLKASLTMGGSAANWVDQLKQGYCYFWLALEPYTHFNPSNGVDYVFRRQIGVINEYLRWEPVVDTHDFGAC